MFGFFKRKSWCIGYDDHDSPTHNTGTHNKQKKERTNQTLGSPQTNGGEGGDLRGCEALGDPRGPVSPVFFACYA